MRDVMLITHFIGISMFIGTGFAFMFLEIFNAKLEKDEKLKFTKRILPLSRMGHIGLFILIMSGGYLGTPYWKVMDNLPLFRVKLLLVLLLIIVISVMAVFTRKAKKGNEEYYFKKIEPLSKISFLLGFSIIILAVMNFH
ncbi:hypothetical protein [Aureivirga sp. CE67]|uniref:hypothetical protein n=1 Tax=Aureivirga sp. CE67 TaxID=1788983 RepID=UPI0018C9ACEC|nr:hypothetical protein [Aureivirga sp. CE67]